MDVLTAVVASRARLLLAWPMGLGRILWLRRPGGPRLRRTDGTGDVTDLPAGTPVGVDLTDLQSAADGVGPLLHRRYHVDVEGADLGAEQLMAVLQAEPNDVVPEIAVFDKTRGTSGLLAVGDEFRIRMPGPWDGPVRVGRVTPTSFLLLTLSRHLEAGQIEFRSADGPDGSLTFVIESWARPGDWFSHLFYNRIGVAREIQLTLWVQTCIAAAARSGGRLRDGVHIDTRDVVTDPSWVRRRGDDSRP